MVGRFTAQAIAKGMESGYVYVYDTQNRRREFRHSISSQAGFRE